MEGLLVGLVTYRQEVPGSKLHQFIFSSSGLEGWSTALKDRGEGGTASIMFARRLP